MFEQISPVDAGVRRGHMYLNGWGFPQSAERAVKQYSEAAHKGNAEAMYNLVSTFSGPLTHPHIGFFDQKGGTHREGMRYTAEHSSGSAVV